MDETNVLVIMTDELRRDTLGCYGNKIVQTPNIDALANRGVQFENAYTPSPICVPARASIATGQYSMNTDAGPMRYHTTVRLTVGTIDFAMQGGVARP